ncbi:sulfide reductase [Iocasia frigidifontis]|uniref:Sulfide reductase n=2 Tax=Iocasia fonsfrigidae TaxID=2682810 RepID=A0A8A7KDL6_9FIRM|nr:sulfide reductase [Halocella sp. SP3-1]MTI59072.1 sulfide reductase [Bacillota bacterium]QTL99886.1 sulfide reductase [Iocasia fonsfrigidae]
MFSGDYDKALAALILANSAKDIGLDATIFFAFWGLFLIRDPKKFSVEDKTQYEKMFGMVTPKGPEELPLSRMNMSGLGKKMLEKMMEDDDTPLLSNFLQEARNNGVEFFGCQLSVEVMGIKKEELLAEVEIITAQDYLKDALNSNIQLFI